MPQGAFYDSYNLNLFVQIIDDSNGIARYDIDTIVTVKPNAQFSESLIDSILANDQTSTFVQNLESGNLQTISQTIIPFASQYRATIPEVITIYPKLIK